MAPAVQTSSSDSDTGPEPDEIPTGNPNRSYFRELTDHAFITPEVLAYRYPGRGTAKEPYSVGWIPGDDRNPMTFHPFRKALITGIVSSLSLSGAFASSVYSGCMHQIRAEMHVSVELATAGLSLYVLGFAVGPIVWAPLSEMIGRQVVIIGTFLAFTLVNIGSACSNNIAALLALRFLGGSFCSSSMTNSGAIISDMYEAKDRGIPIAMFALAPFMGPIIGPIVGGYLGEAAGWRWVEGLTAIISGTLCLSASIIVPETYSLVLLRKKAKVLSKMTGKVYTSAMDIKTGAPPTFAQQMIRGFSRPLSLVIWEPSLLFLSVYMSLLYGILYMFFAALPVVFQTDRGWGEGKGGTAFLGVLVGEIIAGLYCVPDNIRYVRRAKKCGGQAQPEDRLPPAMVAAVAIPVSLFWFAWTCDKNMPPMVSIVGTAPFGFGVVLVFIAGKNYIVDSYTVFSASGIAAAVIMRSLFGAAFPMFTTYMYTSLGNNWAASIPAFFSLLCAPLPFILYIYGGRIRQKCRYSKEAIALSELAEQHDEPSASESDAESKQKPKPASVTMQGSVTQID